MSPSYKSHGIRCFSPDFFCMSCVCFGRSSILVLCIIHTFPGVWKLARWNPHVKMQRLVDLHVSARDNAESAWIYPLGWGFYVGLWGRACGKWSYSNMFLEWATRNLDCISLVILTRKYGGLIIGIVTGMCADIRPPRRSLPHTALRDGTVTTGDI